MFFLRTFLLLLSFEAVAFGQTGLSGKPVPLPVVYSNLSMGSSPVWIIDKAGIFRKHGLDVSLTLAQGNLPIQAMLAGSFDIGFVGAVPLIGAVLSGAQLKLTATMFDKILYGLATSRDITTGSQLKGKRVAVSQIGSSSDFVARYALRQVGLNPEKDVAIVALGPAGERWAALQGGHVDATIVQPPLTLLARKAGLSIFIDLAKVDFEYTISGVVTIGSFIRSEPETVMNFMRGLADGMDFYRDERNKDQVVRILGEYFRSNATEELEETRRAYSQVTPGLPLISAKSIENVIANDKNLAGLGLKPEEILDLSFLQKLQQERKAKR